MTNIPRRDFLRFSASGVALSLFQSLPEGIAGTGEGLVGSVPEPVWAVPSLPYRILVEVPDVHLTGRRIDRLPASLELDFASPQFTPLALPAAMDLDSIQVIRYDRQTGTVLPGPPWPFARTQGERASRFLDKSLPWDFPVMRDGSNADSFPRGAFFLNVKGNGNPGLLVWDHTQEGKTASNYAVYFDTRDASQPWKSPRQGFIGDGSPRRDVKTPSLSGTLYNRAAVDDWDGDGLLDLILGVDTGLAGYILLFKNTGTHASPQFGPGVYLHTAEGDILIPGNNPSPCIADWNGDGIKDLVVGIEGPRVVWYENVGNNIDRKFVYRGTIKVDGEDLITPAKPCPEAPHYTRDYAPTVEIVDWNGDGKLDLLLGGNITGYIWYYENVGENPDGTPQLRFCGPLEADGKPIDTNWGAAPCAVDLNGDGKLDLITGSSGQRMGGGYMPSPFLIYYENVGSRTEPRLTQRPVQYEGNEPTEEITATPRPFGTNKNGLTNLIISTCLNVFIANNVGTSTVPRWKVERQDASWGITGLWDLNATQVIDLNEDGHLDLVQSPLDGADATPTIRINKNVGAHGVFGPPEPLLPKGQEISHPAPYGDPWAFVYLHDFDGNGVRDILWVDGPGFVYLHRNLGSNQQPIYDVKGEQLMLENGTPVHVGPSIVQVESVPDFTVMQGSRAGVAAADFNRDGRTDLALGDTFGDVYYFENRGTNAKPIFAAGVKLGNLGERALPLAYDWDRDGNVDILGIAWSGQMAWYRNLGPGVNPQFDKGRRLNLPPTVPYSPRIVIADWDGDGDDDLLIMSSFPSFCWLDGSYIAHGYIPANLLKVEARLPATNKLRRSAR